jgi:hypothetical protein
MRVHPSVHDQGSTESRRRDQLTAGPTCHRERTQPHAETVGDRYPLGPLKR